MWIVDQFWLNNLVNSRISTVAAKKPQPLIRNYMEMLRVKLVYDNQVHDKHGF